MHPYKNHHQIYTHSITHGVIIGQYWVYTRVIDGNTYTHSGRVMAITESGNVILQPDNLVRCPLKVPIDKLGQFGKLKTPVMIFPYQRVNKTVGIQVMALFPEYNLRLIVGELRRNYTGLETTV